MPIILSDARARAVVARGSERVKESDAKEREIASHDVGYEESANLRYAKDPPTTARAKRVYTYRPTYLLLLVFFFFFYSGAEGAYIGHEDAAAFYGFGILRSERCRMAKGDWEAG